MHLFVFKVNLYRGKNGDIRVKMGISHFPMVKSDISYEFPLHSWRLTCSLDKTTRLCNDSGEKVSYFYVKTLYIQCSDCLI